MNETIAASLPETCDILSAFRLPRWAELPDLPLYMDQVLGLIERYLGAYPGFDKKGLTSSMVNNYVKLGVMPPPVKKKYTRSHLANLIVICILKASLPIAAIRSLIAGAAENAPEQALYERFCEAFERSNRAAAEKALAEAAEAADDLSPLWHAALRSQAEQAIARTLVDSCSGKAE